MSRGILVTFAILVACGVALIISEAGSILTVEAVPTPQALPVGAEGPVSGESELPPVPLTNPAMLVRPASPLHWLHRLLPLLLPLHVGEGWGEGAGNEHLHFTSVRVGPSGLVVTHKSG